MCGVKGKADSLLQTHTHKMPTALCCENDKHKNPFLLLRFWKCAFCSSESDQESEQSVNEES